MPSRPNAIEADTRSQGYLQGAVSCSWWRSELCHFATTTSVTVQDAGVLILSWLKHKVCIKVCWYQKAYLTRMVELWHRYLQHSGAPEMEQEVQAFASSTVDAGLCVWSRICADVRMQRSSDLSSQFGGRVKVLSLCDKFGPKELCSPAFVNRHSLCPSKNLDRASWSKSCWSFARADP